MALTSEQVLAISKKYTDDSIEGAGALRGAPCEIQSIEPITGGNRIIFLWEDKDGNSHTDTLDVMDGDDGAPGIPGTKGDPGEKGADGDPGFSPTIVVKKATSEEYILTITDKTGSYDTPNLKGSGSGVIGTYSNENLSLT